MMITDQPEHIHLKNFTINEVIDLPQQGSWQPSRHLLEKESAYALEMALATGRPLLVRGEPGVGKSQLARAAAVKLERLFISHVVNISSEGQDLLWHYDPVARLNDAQALRHSIEDEKRAAQRLHPQHYLNPGVLWWAFDWASAKTQYDEHCKHKLYCPKTSGDHGPEQGVVLLLDEIDKADPSLPNTLLEALGNGGFEVPLLNQTVTQKAGSPPPLVIITTNEERELPPAFLRRCLVLNLAVDEDDLESWLMRRGEVHFPERFSLEVKRQAAECLKSDREAAKNRGTVKPGQAEYLDLLQALHELTENEPKQVQQARQLEWLNEIKGFAFSKAPRE